MFKKPRFQARREDDSPSQWDRYRVMLQKNQVPYQAQRWYVSYIEVFVAHFHPRRVSQLDRDEITNYLHDWVGKNQPPHWQLQQVIDAIQILMADLLNVHSVRWAICNSRAHANHDACLSF